jgi:hypothetical protein
MRAMRRFQLSARIHGWGAQSFGPNQGRRFGEIAVGSGFSMPTMSETDIRDRTVDAFDNLRRRAPALRKSD